MNKPSPDDPKISSETYVFKLLNGLPPFGKNELVVKDGKKIIIRHD